MKLLLMRFHRAYLGFKFRIVFLTIIFDLEWFDVGPLQNLLDHRFYDCLQSWKACLLCMILNTLINLAGLCFYRFKLALICELCCAIIEETTRDQVVQLWEGALGRLWFPWCTFSAFDQFLDLWFEVLRFNTYIPTFRTYKNLLFNSCIVPRCFYPPIRHFVFFRHFIPFFDYITAKIPYISWHISGSHIIM